jgi:hypothetical protein
LYSFLSGTSTPQSLYADAELTTALPNPLVLDSSGEALFYYGPAQYKLALHDAQDVPQWVIDPVAGTGGGAAAAGMGLGSNTVELRPAASAALASTVVFPATVLALGLTVWVEETFGTSQGLTHLGIGTVDHPDCWGVLTDLTADTQTHAGVFLGYSGQPMPADGTVTLTAYGGLFDGTGAVYLTGHFATFAPSHALGLSWTPPGPPSPEPPAPQPYATEMSPGVVELVDAAEVLADTDLTRALTIGRLVSRTGTPSRLGLVRTATPAAVVTGTNDTDAATPLGVAQALAPVIAVNTTQSTDIAALQAKLPAGTALSVVRYASDGQALQSAPGVLTTANANQLVLGSNVSNLGVGAPLVIEQNLSTQLVMTGGAVTATSNTAGIVLRGAKTSLAAPTPLQSGDLAGFLRWGGYADTWQNNLAACEVLATETWSATARGTRLAIYTTLSGQATRGERLRIDGNGYVGIATTAPQFPLHVAGTLAYGLPTAEPASASLSPGQMAWWLSEADNTLRALIKRSDGTLRRVSLATTT